MGYDFVALALFMNFCFVSKTIFPKLNFALIPIVKFTYPPRLFLFLSRCLQSYVFFIHVIIHYVMFLTYKRILNLVFVDRFYLYYQYWLPGKQ